MCTAVSGPGLALLGIPVLSRDVQLATQAKVHMPFATHVLQVLNQAQETPESPAPTL